MKRVFTNLLQRTGKTITEYRYKLFNINLFSGKAKNSFALFESFVYNESVGDLLPLSRDVYTYYQLDYFTITNNLEECKQELIEKSIAQARENLPIGNIINEETQTSVVNDTMFAITTIKISGIIND